MPGKSSSGANGESSFRSSMFAPALLIAVFALILCSRYISEDELGMRDNPYLSVVVIQLLTYAVPSLFYVKLRGKSFSSRLRIRVFPLSKMLYVFHSAVFMLCGVALLSIAMYTSFPDLYVSSSASSNAAFAMNNRFFDAVYLITAFAILPAVTEEFLFRGIVTAEYESRSVGCAVVISAVMFAMSHFSLARFPVYLFSGIVLALTMYATRSILAPIIVHTLNNIFVLFGEKYVLKIVDKQNTSFVLFVLILGAILVISGMLMCYEAYGIYHAYAESNVPSDYAPRSNTKMNVFGRIAETFFTPTFLLLVIIFIVASMM